MKLEQDLHYEKHKSRYLVRRIKEMAKQLGDPDYAVTEEELNGPPNRECPSFWPAP